MAKSDSGQDTATFNSWQDIGTLAGELTEELEKKGLVQDRSKSVAGEFSVGIVYNNGLNVTYKGPGFHSSPELLVTSEKMDASFKVYPANGVALDVGMRVVASSVPPILVHGGMVSERVADFLNAFNDRLAKALPGDEVSRTIGNVPYKDLLPFALHFADYLSNQPAQEAAQ